jgi:hypothetical protein
MFGLERRLAALESRAAPVEVEFTGLGVCPQRGAIWAITRMFQPGQRTHSRADHETEVDFLARIDRDYERGA